MFRVLHTEQFGRGLYATRPIDQDTIIMMCEVLVLSEVDTPKVNATELQYYTFKYNETQDCLVLGLGEIFNHDDYENVKYYLTEITDHISGLTRQVMVFQAKTHIFNGEQLFINYNTDVAVNSDEYKNQTSLVG